MQPQDNIPRVKKEYQQDSLSQRISNNQELTETEQAELYELLGAHAHAKTKEALSRALEHVPHVNSYGIYDRVLITPRVQYIAGQSYPDEIRTVRELLIGRIS